MVHDSSRSQVAETSSCMVPNKWAPIRQFVGCLVHLVRWKCLCYVGAWSSVNMSHVRHFPQLYRWVKRRCRSIISLGYFSSSVTQTMPNKPSLTNEVPFLSPGCSSSLFTPGLDFKSALLNWNTITALSVLLNLSFPSTNSSDALLITLSACKQPRGEENFLPCILTSSYCVSGTESVLQIRHERGQDNRHIRIHLGARIKKQETEFFPMPNSWIKIYQQVTNCK